jgi:hypothetical protein
MTRYLLTAALLLFAVPASAQSIGSAPYVVMTLGSSVDLATTLEGLASGRAQEGNPFLAVAGTPGVIGGKVAATAGLAWLMQRLGRSGHPRAAKVLGFTAGVALAGLGARNARVGR